MKETRDKEEYRRASAIKQKLEGLPYRTIAGNLDVNYRNVYNWIKEYKEYGLDGIRSKRKNAGRIPKISSDNLYYTASAKQLFMRVKVDPISFNPVGEVEVVGGGRFDDFWIDQDAGFAYLASHPLNTIDRLALEPSENGSEILSIAGNPFNDELIGPSAGHWGRGRDEYGRVAFVTTDGGTASPPARGARPARLIKV